MDKEESIKPNLRKVIVKKNYFYNSSRKELTVAG